MKNLLACAAAGVLTFAGVGWYLDWYHIRSGPVSLGGHQSVNIDINTEKIGEDVAKGEKKVADKLHDAKEKSSQDGVVKEADSSKTDPLPNIHLVTPNALQLKEDSSFQPPFGSSDSLRGRFQSQ